MADRPDLAALIGSRICHDLIGPIGAIGNGVELLALEGGTRGPEMALIAESVAQANARIRFFRIAFGGAGQDQRIARSEVQQILADLTRGGRLTIDWTSPADLARAEARAAFLAIQCLETALPWGGRILVERGETRWTLAAQGRRMRIEPATWDLLAAPAPPAGLEPAQVQFALLPEELARQGRRLTADLRETEARLAF